MIQSLRIIRSDNHTEISNRVVPKLCHNGVIEHHNLLQTMIFLVALEA